MFWKVPAMHCVHVSARAEGVYVPGEHGVGVLDPTLQLVPAGHTMQSLVRLLR